MERKNILCCLFVAVLFISCAKDKKDKPVSKTVMLQKRSHTSGSSTWAVAYFFNDNGVATQYKATGALGNYTVSLQRNTAGKITRVNFSDGFSGYYTIEYDGAGRMSKVLRYDGTGTLGSYSTYTYSDNGYEESRYTAAGNFGGKDIYQYTADKKDIATKKSYNAVNVQTTEQTNTYTNKPNPYNVYPEAEMQQISGVLPGEHASATETTVTISSGVSVTRTFTYTYDSNGYITGAQAVFTDGRAPLNSSFSYIVK